MRLSTDRRRLQLFAAIAVLALAIRALGQRELAIGVIVAGLFVLPSDWYPRG